MANIRKYGDGSKCRYQRCGADLVNDGRSSVGRVREYCGATCRSAARRERNERRRIEAGIMSKWELQLAANREARRLIAEGLASKGPDYLSELGVNRDAVLAALGTLARELDWL